MTSAEQRNADVAAVLAAADHGLSSGEIALAIKKPWCMRSGWPCSPTVSPVLKRIGAIKLRHGVWVAATQAPSAAKKEGQP